MQWWWWRAAVVIGISFFVVAGCTTVPNPRSCADNFCDDPAYPFCDVDGTIGGGDRLTCIAVDCTPFEFEACRGDEAIVCNDMGNNYNINHCDGGCRAEQGGCVTECADSSACANSEPVCDTTDGICRGCRSDSECASSVCDDATGVCADPDSVIYVEWPGSLDTNCGNRALPCSFETAFKVASPTRNLIKLAPEQYESYDVVLQNTDSAVIYGHGATVLGYGYTILNIKESQQLTIHGLTLIAAGPAPAAISCSTTGSFTPTVVLDRVSITTDLWGLHSVGCNVDVDRSQFVMTNPQYGAGVILDSVSGGLASKATIRRSRFNHRVGIAIAERSRAEISNCVFTNNSPAISLAQLPGEGTVTFSTFVNSPLNCGDGDVALRFANNILYGTSNDTLVQGTRCQHSFSLITPLADPPSGDHILANVNPAFVDVTNNDLRLTSGSPAIDAADPTITVDDDFDGMPRPRGSARDLGAFEFGP